MWRPKLVMNFVVNFHFVHEMGSDSSKDLFLGRSCFSELSFTAPVFSVGSSIIGLVQLGSVMAGSNGEGTLGLSSPPPHAQHIALASKSASS